MVMATGELEFLDFSYGNQTSIEDFPGERALQMEIYFGRMIFVAFVFLFAIVVLNLLNAIAIGDVQVIILTLPIHVTQ